MSGIEGYFRNKPVVVQAFQMTEPRRDDKRDWPEWLNRAWNQEAIEGSVWILPDDPTRLFCGRLRIAWGDWIIRSANGDISHCKPDIFALTYEPVEPAFHMQSKRPDLGKSNL